MVALVCVAEVETIGDDSEELELIRRLSENDEVGTVAGCVVSVTEADWAVGELEEPKMMDILSENEEDGGVSEVLLDGGTVAVIVIGSRKVVVLVLSVSPGEPFVIVPML